MQKKVFEFAAGNSDVEWGLSGYKNGDWVVGTIHDNDQAPAFHSMDFKNYDLKNKNYDAHSHPGYGGVHFTPSGKDMDAAYNLTEANSRSQSWLYMPMNPTTRWLRLK